MLPWPQYGLHEAGTGSSARLVLDLVVELFKELGSELPHDEFWRHHVDEQLVHLAPHRVQPLRRLLAQYVVRDLLHAACCKSVGHAWPVPARGGRNDLPHACG